MAMMLVVSKKEGGAIAKKSSLYIYGVIFRMLHTKLFSSFDFCYLFSLFCPTLLFICNVVVIWPHTCAFPILLTRVFNLRL
jgi:hypothetical protein